MNLESIWKITCRRDNSDFKYFYAFRRLILAGPYAIKPKRIAIIQKEDKILK